MTQTIDMRGDWAARPTAAMRQAMAAADVGDDNSQEDPTVIRLEEMAADMTGKEAGLFVPSGTMGNLVSILALTPHGTEIIAGDQAHSVVYERGGFAAIGGHPLRTVPNDHLGMMSPDSVRDAIRPTNIHFPKTGLLLLENTHNLCGGTVLSSEQIKSLSDIAREHDIPVHLDGSRIFNAAAAMQRPVSDMVRDVDSVTFCLSKGLAAPIGSMVTGSATFIDRAREFRKLLGGGMRQAGVIAAAGIVGLCEMVDRLPEDHENARYLAEGLADLPGISVNLETVQSNIVFIDVGQPLDGTQITSELGQAGIRINQFTHNRLRFATHYEITRDDIDTVLHTVRTLVR